MTQIASLLAVATVFIDLWTLLYSQGGGGLIRETKLPMQELELNMQGALNARGGGGVIADSTVNLYGHLHVPTALISFWI